MTDKIRPIIYIRKNRPDTAVIYVRGHDKEAEDSQEIKCRMYAKDKGYEVVGVTRYIEDVKSCDVLLVANFSRISRKRLEFEKTRKLFKARGVRIESVSRKNNGDNWFLKDIYEAIEKYEKEHKNK